MKRLLTRIPVEFLKGFCLFAFVFNVSACGLGHQKGRPTPAEPGKHHHRFYCKPLDGFKWPLENLEISSDYGWRLWFDKHQGVDLRASAGVPVHAAADGVVISQGWQSGYGNMIKIRHKDDIITVYAHNQKNMVRIGQEVECGQVIATVGRTGNASGSHLHFELILNGRPVNPERYID